MFKKIYTDQLVEILTKTIEEPFLLKKISLCQTQASAKKYFDLLLQDKKGYVKAKVWDLNMDDRYLTFEDHIVLIKGQVILNSKEEIELLVNALSPLSDYDIADYINGLTQKDTDGYVALLFKYIQKVKHEGYSDILNRFFSANMESFKAVPASLKHFNNYNGGLLVRTICTTCLAYNMRNSLNTYNYDPRFKNHFNDDLLISSSLLHSIGTVDLLLPFPEAKKISSSVLLSVYELTVIRLSKIISENKISISQEDFNLLIHCIHTIYNDDLKPMVREAVLLRSAYQLQTSISRMDYFIHVNKKAQGSVYDEKLKNYVYISKREESTHGKDISGK